jgi:hypothetical protein
MPQLFCCGRVRGLRRGDTTRSVQNRAGPVCSKRDILRGSLSRGGAVPAAIDFKAVPGIGAEIVLTVNGEMRKTRLFRSHEQAELVGAIADTRRDARTLAEWCKTAQTDTPTED